MALQKSFANAPRRALAALATLAALAATPQLASADMNAARRALDNGDYLGAFREAGHHLQTNPADAHWVRAKASVGLAEQKKAEGAKKEANAYYVDAAGEFQRALSYQPKNRELIILVGDALKGAGHHSQAADYLGLAHDLDPSDFDTLSAYLDMLKALNRTKPFIEVATKGLDGLTKDDQRRIIYERLSDAQAKLEEWAKSADALEASQKYHQPDADQLLELATKRQKAKQWKLAAQVLETAKAADAANSQVVYQLGETRWTLNEQDKAVDEYVLLTRLDPALVNQTIRNDSAKWTAVQRRVNWLAIFLHPKYGMLPFFAGVGAVLLLIIVVAVVLIKRWGDDD